MNHCVPEGVWVEKTLLPTFEGKKKRGGWNSVTILSDVTISFTDERRTARFSFNTSKEEKKGSPQSPFQKAAVISSTSWYCRVVTLRQYVRFQ